MATRADIDLIHPARRHFYIGTNCFQFAANYSPILISVGPPHASGLMQLFDYATLSPGHSGREFQRTRPTKFEDVKKCILQGCDEDQIVTTPDILEEKDGYRLCALYFKEGDASDFHFVRKDNDGKWRWTMPFSDICVSSEKPPEIDGYQFDRLVLIPKDFEPLGVKDLAPKILTMPTEIGDIQFASIEFGNNPSGIRIVADFNRNAAIDVEKKFMFALPFYGKPLFSPRPREIPPMFDMPFKKNPDFVFKKFL